MCIIESFDIVYPGGVREPREILHYCEYGTPINPCNNTVRQRTEDRIVPSPEAPPAPERLFGEVEGHRRESRKPRKFMDGLKLVFNFRLPFTSKTDKKKRKKKKKKKSEGVYVRRPVGEGHYSPPQFDHPHGPRVPPPYPPLQGQPEVVHLPPQRSPEMTPYQVGPRVQTIRPRYDRSRIVELHQNSSSSSSPEGPLRRHRRKESVDREYEAMKRRIEEEERREHAERMTREAEIRRLRAEREAERINDNQERLNRRAERLALVSEIAHLRAERDAEIVRRHAAEDRRIRHEDRRSIESAEERQRRREQEDFEREQARLLQEQEDRERIQAATLRDDRRRARAERERLERLRGLNIPRGPRHHPTVSQRPQVSFAERGEQVINDAIREENQGHSWRRAPSPGRGWPRRRDVGGGLRRRDTIAVGQRRVYDDDRRRGGGRFV